MTQLENLLGYRGTFAEPVRVLGRPCAHVEQHREAKDLWWPWNERLSTHRGPHCPCCSQPAGLPSCLARRPYRNTWWMGELWRHPELLIWAGDLRVHILLPGHITQGTRQRLGVTQQLLGDSEVLSDFPFFVGRAALEGTAGRNRNPSAAGSRWRFCVLLWSSQGLRGVWGTVPLTQPVPQGLYSCGRAI